MPSLFRPEVIEGQRRAWLGQVQLTRPPSLTFLTVFVMGLTLVIAAYLSVGEYTRKSRVTGYLVPDSGVMRLLSPQTGTVIESRAVEGQSVRRGDVLFVLSLDRATLNGDTQATVQSSLSARERSLQASSRQQVALQQAQAAALDQQVQDMKRELAQMAAEGDLQRQRLVLAQQTKARLEALRADNFVSSAQVQTKAEEVLGLQAQLQGLERQRSAQLREIGVLEARRRELPLRGQAQQGEIERDLAAIAQQSAENEALRRIVVRAPQDGVVTAVLALAGQSAASSTALASLVPANARMQAQLFAPSSALGFLHAQQTVLLRYQAYPYQKFGHQGGRVLQVSRTPLQTAELAALGMSDGVGQEPMYRITVALDAQAVQAYGQAQPLTAGMQLEADVLLERRRLIEWMFAPVLGIAGRV